jgi:RHS repeat-associated protein
MGCQKLAYYENPVYGEKTVHAKKCANYSYFGARYYLSDISIWASVDPMAEDAPGWTPYRYCFNNPINLIDPDGRSESTGDGIPTKYYDQKGTLIEDVNDGIDQSVEVNREQYQSARSAYNGSNSFKNQKDGALFTRAYASLARKFGQPYTVKGNWSSVNDVLAGKKYISYSSQGDCNKAARAQNEVGNASPGGADSRIDIASNSDGRIIPVSGNLMKALRTLHYNLNRGYPVMVGVNRENNPDMGNYNSATNHFINIVGRGNDYYGNYFDYRDNAFEGGGRLYLNNGFIQTIPIGGFLPFLIQATEVRPNVSYR